MKKYLLLFLIIVICSCQSGGSTNDLQSQVRAEIEKSLQKKGINLQVTSFVLTHISGNEYAGILVTNEEGIEYTYPVNVIYDGETYLWEIPPTEGSVNSEENVQETIDDIKTNESIESENYNDSQDLKNMSEAMENISDPSYCSLCQGSGIEVNRARGMGLGADEYGRVCPMCDGKGYRTY
jgi:hypothetical protein